MSVDSTPTVSVSVIMTLHLICCRTSSYDSRETGCFQRSSVESAEQALRQQHYYSSCFFPFCSFLQSNGQQSNYFYNFIYIYIATHVTSLSILLMTQ